MALTTAQLTANITITGASEAKSTLQDVGQQTDKTGSILKGALGGALGAAAGLATSALGGLKDVLVDSVHVAMEHQQVMSQTTQVVKSTGAAAGMSAKSVDDLADSLSRTTTFSHDNIQAGENLMLTFTGIGKQVFPDATKAMLDLSQATGQSMKSSAIQLGKALNDPTTGLTALSRVGVSFSAQEKEQIKTMMAHKDVMGAQKIMLKELETEFGGSAVAAGKTFAGQMAIMSNVIEDVKEKIGTALLPILNQFMGFISTVGMPILQKFADWFTNSAIPAIQNFLTKTLPLGELFTYIGKVASSAMNDVQGILKSLSTLIQPVIDKFSSLGDTMPKLGSSIHPVEVMVTQLYMSFHNAAQNIEKALGEINIEPLLNSVTGAMSHINLKPIMDMFGSLGGLIGNALSHIDFNGLGSGIKTVGQVMMNLSPAVNIFQALSSHAQDLAKWFNTSVVPALKQAAPGFANLGSAINGLLPLVLTISNVVHTVFQAAFDALLPVFMKLIPIVIQVAGIIASLLGNAIKFLTPYILQATTAIGQFAADILQRVSPILVQFFTGLQQNLNNFMKLWNTIWPFLAPFLQGVWNSLVGIVKIAWALLSGIIKIGLDVLSGNWAQAWTDLKSMLSGVWGGIVSIIHGEIDIMIGVLNLGIAGLNAFIDAVENALDSAASAIGLGRPIPITTIPKVPTYASGTDNHPGGPAIVGEKGPELVMLPAGSSVMTADATRGVLAGVPGYASGSGNALQDLMNWAAGGAKSILDNIMKGIKIPDVLGPTLNLGAGVANTLEKWITDWITKNLIPKTQEQAAINAGSAGPGTPVNVSGSLISWLQSAMALTGVPQTWLSALEIIAMHESGGNPNAVNNWDSNAAAGHPSEGLMQTIGPTFAAYMVAGHANILNPIDNAAAAINYIKSRYGSVFNVPGIVSMAGGGAYQGYANGTSFAEGGMSWVGERGKELMYVPRGAQITPHESLNNLQQQPQIVVQSPVYLDGRLLSTGLLPHVVNAIRYNTGSRDY